jgi:hypothetical protein
MARGLTGTGGFPRKVSAILIVAAMSLSGNVWAVDPIVTDSTSRSTSDSTSSSTSTSTNTSNSTTTTNGSTTTKVISPPPTAVAPAVTIINSDVCAVGFSGAAQTQILGISFGGSTTDRNCERLKLARGVYDMGMKVAAVAIMCQDERVFTAMMNAGTPCPVDGKIGEQAKAIWEAEPDRKPQKVKSQD